MSTLVSNDSTISEEIPIDYENKVAIYDDYCGDMYVIRLQRIYNLWSIHAIILSVLDVYGLY